MPEVFNDKFESGVRGQKGGAGASSGVIEPDKLREVMGILPSRLTLDASVESLRQRGFDRADIDVMDLRQRAPGNLDIADGKKFAHALRSHTREDIIASEAVVAGVFASIGAVATAFAVMGAGGGFGWAVAAAAGAAVVAAGAAVLLMMRFFGQRFERSEVPDAPVDSPGLMLWVRVHTTEQERAALSVLKGYGAQGLREHQITIIRDSDGIPSSSPRTAP
jgi:hypothetical protein